MGDLDLEVSDILTGAVSIEEAGQRIYDEILAVASRRYTYTELYGTAQSTISVHGCAFLT